MITAGVLPHDLDMERAVLGALIVDGSRVDQVVGLISEKDFFRHAHVAIFRAIVHLTSAGVAIDVLTLRSACAAAGVPDDEITPSYLSQLTDGVPRSSNVLAYAQRVREFSAARRALRGLATAYQVVLDDPSRVDTALELLTLERDHSAVGVPRFVDDVEIMGLPTTPWLIEPILPGNSIGFVFGAPGTGKTFVVISIAMALAANRPWLGHAVTPGASGPVVLVTPEGTGGLATRIAAAKIADDIPLDQAVGLHVLPDAVSLLDAQAVSAFVASIRQLQPRLVIFDTLARNCPGLDENSARDCGLVVGHLDRIRRATSASILVVHHSNKADTGERGSTALRGAAEFMWELRAQDDRLTLSCSKFKDAEEFKPIALQLMAPLPGLPSVVVKLAAPYRHAPAIGAAEGLTTAQQKVLEQIASCFQSTGATRPELQAVLPSIKPATLYRAVDALVERGLIAQFNRRFSLTIGGRNVA